MWFSYETKQMMLLIYNYINTHFFHFLQIEDLKKIHYSLNPSHEQDPQKIQISLDGILESKSSLTSLDVYSLKFIGCRNIYPIRIVRPCNRHKYDEQEHFRHVLNDINENGLEIDCAICDNPKRATITCIKAHSARNACQYCENCAVTYLDYNKRARAAIEKKYKATEQRLSQQLTQLENEDEANIVQAQLISFNEEKEQEILRTGRKQLRWPSSTMTGNLRTLEGIEAIVSEIEKNPQILKTDPEFCKGIKGRSLLLQQPSFNMITDVTCEYMHLVCLGVVKRLVSLTFTVGENRERVTKRKLSPPYLYNNLIKDIQVVREFGRRCINLDFGVMKAAEFRNIVLFFFPIVLKCIEDDYSTEKQMWLHLVYMIRSCVIPNEEFINVKHDDIASACEKFYMLYEELFGQNNCSYSIHMTPSHLLLIRGDEPLTYRSAFQFENFFSEIRNLFQPGTVSPLKQILQNCFVKRILEHHVCEKETYFAPEKKPKPGVKLNPGKENNHLIYTFNKDNTITMYSIIEIINHNHFKCNVQGKFPLNLALIPEYDWSTVGVFKVGPRSEETKIVKRKNVKGKVLKVCGYLITCPLNVLHEQ